MKVGELQRLLEGYDEDMDVRFAYQYGDYWKSVLAGDISEVSQQEVYWSEYHRQFQVPDPERDRNEDEHEREHDVVLLHNGEPW